MCCITFHSIESSCSQRNWVITNWAEPDNAEVQSEDLIHTQVEVKKKKKKQEARSKKKLASFPCLVDLGWDLLAALIIVSPGIIRDGHNNSVHP
jgi:hypothetical protein